MYTSVLKGGRGYAFTCAAALKIIGYFVNDGEEDERILKRMNVVMYVALVLAHFIIF